MIAWRKTLPSEIHRMRDWEPVDPKEARRTRIHFGLMLAGYLAITARTIWSWISG